MPEAELTQATLPAVDVVPLGGLGEFGLHCLAITCADTTIVIDAGSMFPDADLPGVDLMVPAFDYLAARPGRVQALVLTHGHEDHVGAVPYLMPLVEGPVLGSGLTLAMVGSKFEEHGIDPSGRLREVQPRDRITIGPFTIEFLRVTHSMPGCFAVAVHTPVGVLLHTGDFKIDPTPLDGEHFDLPRFAELGQQGVLALFADSTNVDRPGVTGSESDVRRGFEELFTSTDGKLIVAAFSSSLYRMQVLVDLAAEFDRRVAFVGRGMQENSQIAQQLGHLRLPAGVQMRDGDVSAFPAQDVLCLVTGSQGEPNAALSRIAIDDHRQVRLAPGDTVVLSARAIPGNDKAIGRVLNHLARRAVRVITADERPVHVSGHASEEELKLILSLVRPRYFVPVHGEYRHLARHARIAGLVTAGLPSPTTVMTIEDGDCLRFDATGGHVVDRIETGRVLIDVTRVGEVGDDVIRDRRHLAADGLIVPVVAVNQQTGAVEGLPELVARGFVTAPEPEAAVLREGAELIAATVAACRLEERTDPGLLRDRIRDDLRRFLRKRTGRRPMILPVVLEI